MGVILEFYVEDFDKILSDVGTNRELIDDESEGNKALGAGDDDGPSTEKRGPCKQAETGNTQSDGSGEKAAVILTSVTNETPTDEGSGENVASAVVQEPSPVPSATDVATPDVVPKAVPPTPPVTPISSGDQSPPAIAPLPIQTPVSIPATLPATSPEATSEPPVPTPAAVDAASATPISEKPEVSVASEVVSINKDLPTTNAAASIDVIPAAVNVIAPVTESSPILATTTQSEAPKDDGWKKYESDLLSAIADLESVKNEASSDAFKLQTKVKDEEIEILKARVKTLETELAAALTRPGSKNKEIVENIKHQHEELLSKARGMIFDQTKMVKNQELQITALTSQVASLKDVNTITKDMLEIRNSEVKHLEERLEMMEARFKAEKERHMLVLKKAETGSTINNDLKKEYETQLSLFKELRERYEQRVQALIAENKKLAESLPTSPEDGATTSAQP